MGILNYLGVVAAIFVLACSGQEEVVIKSERAKIEEASAQQLKGIKQGLIDRTLEIGSACALKVKDFTEGYYVVAKLSNGQTGIWAIYGTKTDTGAHLSVNTNAIRNSNYPKLTKQSIMDSYGLFEDYGYDHSGYNNDG